MYQLRNNTSPRSSQLDPDKGLIVRSPDEHPFSTRQEDRRKTRAGSVNAALRLHGETGS
jgi:hypothetical protein